MTIADGREFSPNRSAEARLINLDVWGNQNPIAFAPIMASEINDVHDPNTLIRKVWSNDVRSRVLRSFRVCARIFS
jgi:hypothetical protein